MSQASMKAHLGGFGGTINYWVLNLNPSNLTLSKIARSNI